MPLGFPYPHCTTKVIVRLSEGTLALLGVAVKVIVYVPAGVPPVGLITVVGVFPPPPHPARMPAIRSAHAPKVGTSFRRRGFEKSFKVETAAAARSSSGKNHGV